MKHSTRRLAVTVAALAAIAAAATGCSTPASSAAGGSDKLAVGFVELHADTFFGNIEKGIKEGLGDTADVITVNYNSDATKETQAYDNLISRKVDVIVTSPLDPNASVAGIRNAAQAGIPVICVNTCINDEAAKQYVTAFVVSDNKALGEKTGARAVTFIKEKLDGKAVIGMLNCDKIALCKVRKDAFTKTLDDAGIQYQVVADQEGYEPDASVPIATAELTSHPDINIIWTANDGGAVGAIKAIQSSGNTGKTFVFGTDVSDAMIDAVLSPDNILQSFTGQDGIANGKAIADIAKKLAADPKYKPASFETLVEVVNFDRSDPEGAKAWKSANG